MHLSPPEWGNEPLEPDHPEEPLMPQFRPWTFVAIAPATKTAPPMAFVYPVSEARQEVAREQLAEMMDRYQQCLDTGQWFTEEEMREEQPCPPPGVYRAWAEEEDEDEMPWEAEDDDV